VKTFSENPFVEDPSAANDRRDDLSGLTYPSSSRSPRSTFEAWRAVNVGKMTIPVDHRDD